MESQNSSLLERIYHKGKIASLVKSSRKTHYCTECHGLIQAGQSYYAITYGGSGLGSIKFPARLHPSACLISNMGFEKADAIRG